MPRKGNTPMAIRLRPITWRRMRRVGRRLAALEGVSYSYDLVLTRALVNLDRTLTVRAREAGTSVEELDRLAGIAGEVEAERSATTGPPSKVEPRLD